MWGRGGFSLPNGRPAFADLPTPAEAGASRRQAEVAPTHSKVQSASWVPQVDWVKPKKLNELNKPTKP